MQETDPTESFTQACCSSCIVPAFRRRALLPSYWAISDLLTVKLLCRDALGWHLKPVRTESCDWSASHFYFPIQVFMLPSRLLLCGQSKLSLFVFLHCISTAVWGGCDKDEDLPSHCDYSRLLLSLRHWARNPTSVSQPFPCLSSDRMAGGSWSYTLSFLHTKSLNELVSITTLLLGS